MKSNREQGGPATRQRIVMIILALVVIFILWQAWGIFGGGGGTKPTTASSAPTAPKPPMPMQPGQIPTASNVAPTAPIPKPAAAQPMTQREMQLMQLQQETEQKYLAAVNELQMLRIEKDIAETNRSIAKAKLDTVSAQKSIVDMLTVKPVAPQSYAQGLGAPQAASTSPTTAPPLATPPAEPTYTVISVSEVQNHWKAVLGYQGTLYSVSIGDIVPPDGWKVYAIDATGVVLEKGKEKKKISLVPII